MKENMKKVCIALLGSAVQAFGLYNVHAVSGVTEGGILGLTLLLWQWFDISPSISSLILNGICYLIGFFVLGKSFIVLSAISGIGFSIIYRVLEIWPPLWPALADMPFAAAVLGAVFIGVGVGLCVRVGAAPGGDDALAMSVNKLSGMKLSSFYFISDAIVLGLSLSYIPLQRIVWSLLTVVLSGQIIDIIARMKIKK
ncbi:MAG: YitT family protein [Oscillospiraceae bacterium]|nr:YitT family protein [Oscillospiraceae bacterium]